MQQQWVEQQMMRDKQEAENELAKRTVHILNLRVNLMIFQEEAEMKARQEVRIIPYACVFDICRLSNYNVNTLQ